MGNKAIERPIPYAEEVIRLPETADSHPFGGTLHQVRPLDLGEYGYVEEEYLLSGKANIYTWEDFQNYADVLRENAAYTTRFIIRKPADPARFSGHVVVEMLNWAREYDRSIALWGNCYQTLLREGDAWVGVTIKAKAINTLKRFDPERYGRLSYENPLPPEERNYRPQSNTYHHDDTDPNEENGLTWDMYSQLGMLFKEDDPRNPLYGYGVKAVIGTGATGGDLATYCAAVAPVSCDPKGGKIYDGFLIFMTGAPGNVNQYEEKLHHMDPRCKFYGKVPLMRVYTCKDMLGGGFHPDWACMQRRADSDEEGRYYRSYEVAGTGLFLKYTYYMEPCHEDVEKAGLAITNYRTGSAWTEEDLATFEFPTRYVLSAALVNLKKWIADGVSPPQTLPFETVNVYPETQLKVDELGNVCGGLRLPYLRVPAYHFQMDANAYPLEKEILGKLYASHEDYVEKVRKAAADCVAERILLPEDAEEIVKEAEALTFI